MTWLYFGGLVLLAGAVVNAVGSGRLEPEDVPFSESDDADADRDPSSTGHAANASGSSIGSTPSSESAIGSATTWRPSVDDGTDSRTG